MATYNERLAELNDDADVLQAVTQSVPAQMEGLDELHEATIRYAWISGDVVRDTSVKLIGHNHGTGSEAWYWERSVPDALRPETKYLASRTASGWGALSGAAQAAAIENFCNDVYGVLSVGAQDIREFSVSPVNGSTVRVSGYFDLGTTWERQTWYIRLIDPNGSVAAPYSNIEFQRVYDEAPAA